MYKDIVLIFLFSFLRINNMIFFNGFVNVLNYFNIKIVDLYDSIKNLNGNLNFLLRI